jgi:hypothetical protein
LAIWVISAWVNGIVEDVHDHGELGVVAGHVDRAHPHAVRLAGALEHRTAADRRRRTHVVVVREQVLGFPIAELLEPPCGVGQVEPHHQHRRRIETLDQEAAFLVDRQVERPQHALHAARAQPVLSDIEQGAKDGGVVLGVEHAEMAGGVLVLLEIEPVDLRADPADRLALAIGEPIPALGMLKIGVFVEAQALAALHQERRHIARAVAIEVVRQPDERIQLAPPIDGLDADLR